MLKDRPAKSRFNLCEMDLKKKRECWVLCAIKDLVSRKAMQKMGKYNWECAVGTVVNHRMNGRNKKD